MSIKEKLWQEYTLRHAEAIWQAEEKRERVYRENPALAEMERELSAIGSRYCMAMVSGGDTAALKEEMDRLQAKRDAFLQNIGADFTPHFQCAKCQDTGMAEDGMCDCFRRELIAENFRRSNLDRSLSHQTFENFDLSLYSNEPQNGRFSPRENVQMILNLCKDFAKNFEKQTKNLLFTGATGLGKTYLSTAIAKELLEQGKSVIYISAPEFARRIEAIRFKDEEGELEQFFGCDLLIIDDLGTESRTSYTMATLADMIDQRLRADKKIIFSTNLNLDGIQKAYDERIVSRLLGHFAYCHFYGEDLRIKAFKEGR